MTVRLRHVYHEYVEVEFDGQSLFRYVYVPATPTRETRKPYFHPVRTLAGNLVTNFRPHDHVWHHGIAMTFAHLSGQNFWGGNSYVHGQGYVQLPNNGRIEHAGWDGMECRPGATAGGGAGAAASGGAARVERPVMLRERLTWISYEGEPWLDEQRLIAVGGIDAAAGYWTLEFGTTLRNVRREPLVFGSPTTAGRPLAGYGSLVWRGPRSFVHGTILAAGGLSGPEIMGQSAPWLAYTGKHDGTAGPAAAAAETPAESTIVFYDRPENPRYPNKWFVRNEPTTIASFALTFDEELTLDPGETLRLSYRILFADGAWTPEQIERHA